MASAALLGVVLALVLLGGKPGGRRPLAQSPENPPTEPSPAPAAGTSSKARPKKAAPANTLIEIQDNGPYAEQLTVPREKEGLTLRAIKRCWPVITLAGTKDTGAVSLVTIDAPRTTLERLVLLRTPLPGRTARCLSITGPSSRVRSALVVMPGSEEAVFLSLPECRVEHCLFAADVFAGGNFGGAQQVIENSLILGALRTPGGNGYQLRFCTVLGDCDVNGLLVITDSIVRWVRNSCLTAARIDNCDVLSNKPFEGNVAPGKGTFSADPLFRDPANLDYRLMPGSPCIGKASDGGDIGCRYTPEMIELCKVALELRRRGIIKF